MDLIANATLQIRTALKKEWNFSESYIQTCIVIEA